MAACARGGGVLQGVRGPTHAPYPYYVSPSEVLPGHPPQAKRPQRRAGGTQCGTLENLQHSETNLLRGK